MASITFQGAITLVGVRLDVSDELVSVGVGRGKADDLTIGDRVQVDVHGANAVLETV